MLSLLPAGTPAVRTEQQQFMKHLLSILAFCGLFATANAQTSATTTASEDVLVEHTCTAACAGGMHAYLHGQKGHTCTTACAVAATTEPKAAGCCAGKKASASCDKGAGKGDTKAEANLDGHKAAGCCAGKAASASCDKGAGKGDAKAEAHADDHAHASKDHACTTACADGKHTYACGEKGHECGASCQHKH